MKVFGGNENIIYYEVNYPVENLLSHPLETNLDNTFLWF